MAGGLTFRLSLRAVVSKVSAKAKRQLVTYYGGAEDLGAVVTKMAGTVGGGGVEEFPAEGEGDTVKYSGARGGEEDAALVRVEDETKRGSMLRSEEGEDESHIGKRGDAMWVVNISHWVREVGV
jgi:hypothetical protein